MKPPHSCTDHGHVWLETDGTPYQRLRGRSDASVSVTCKFCPLTARLPRHSQYSGKRPPGMPVNTEVPPAFQKVVARALAEAAQHDSHTGPGSVSADQA